MTNLDAIRAAALAWHDAGFCVLPTAADGSKRPGVGSWTLYQSEQYPRPNLETTTTAGIGLVCGAVSGGLEMLELEGRAVAEGALALLDDLVPAAGLTGLWLRLTTEPGAYIERTPSGGLHILYRVADAPVPGNTALARRPVTPDEQAADPHQRAKVLAETRGEKGYVIVAPSHGPTHPSGQPWEVTIGQAGQVPTITAAEREQLHRVFRCLDQMPEPERQVDAPRVPRPRVDGSTSPGDAFAAQVDWAEVLEPHGWTEVHRPGGGKVRYWCRPGKTVGISATTNALGTDRFRNFSTSAHPFEDQSYSKFGVYALLNHGGDHSAAARELARQGFGTPSTSYAPEQQRAALAELTGGHDRSTTMDTAGKPDEQWEDPLPLGWPTRLPPFPMDALPGLPGRYAQALAIETQTPPDLAGAIVLGTLSASIGGRVRVVIRRGWMEPTNTYTVPVLAPGSRKSAVVSACEAPLDAAEKRLLEEMAPRVRDAMIERDIRERYADQAKQKAGKSPDPMLIMEAQEAARVADEIAVPAWPRLLTDDATPEELVKLMADQGGRLAAITAEAGIFDNLAGRYAARTNLEPMLKAHAGDSIRVDRRSRDPIRVDRPALTMIATIQPFALRDMVSRPDFGGRGLLARVLWCLPADVVGYRDENAPPVPEDLTAAYRKFVEDLAVDMAKRDTVAHLTLTEQAYKVLIEYMRQVEVMLRPDGPLGASRLLKDWGSKLVGAVARIAGGLHVADTQGGLDEPISEATMASAVRVGEYFRAHAIGALRAPDEVKGDETSEAARSLLTYIIGKGLITFAVRDLRSGPKGFRKSSNVLPVVTSLIELGWLRQAPKGGWEVHPDAERLLQACDRGDRGDTSDVSAAHATSGPVAPPVAQAGDTGDTSTDRRPPVAPVAHEGDTRGDTLSHTLTRENTEGVAPVAPVAPIAWLDGDDTCPACGWGLDSNAHYTNCEATR